MTVWIDADSCPIQVREIVFRASKRLTIPVILVANRPIPFEPQNNVTMHIAANKADAADDILVDRARPTDLVITRDIPLAKRLVDAGIRVINDRGTVFTEQNINERVSVRNMMVELYQQGLMPERTSRFGKKELQLFANAFDRELVRLTRSNYDKDRL